MNETARTGVELANGARRAAPWKVILLGGFTVAVIDILDPIVFWHFRAGVPPLRILQSVAVGLLGRSAIDGGLATGLLGAGLHLFIATCVFGTFFFAARRLPLLRRHAIAIGALYGLCVLAVMNLIVLPLSAAGRPHWAPAVAVNNVLIHIFGIGIVTALITRRALTRA